MNLRNVLQDIPVPDQWCEVACCLHETCQLNKATGQEGFVRHLWLKLAISLHQNAPHLLASKLNGTATHGKEDQVVPLEVRPGQVRPQGCCCCRQVRLDGREQLGRV